VDVLKLTKLNRRYGPIEGEGTHYLAFGLVVIIWLCISETALSAPFVYTAQQEPLPKFLCSFAASQNKSCLVSPDISGDISGNMEFLTPDEFFAFLERSHDLVTYANNVGIWYYPRSAMQSVTIPLNRVTVAALASALRDIEAYDSRWPLRPVSGGRMVRLTAPPEYINQVTSLADELEGILVSAKGVRVFRLRHAWAADIEVNFMNKNTIIPGVASLLWRITAEGAAGPGSVASAVSLGTNEDTVARLRGTGLASRTGTQPTTQAIGDERAMRSNARQPNQTGARILADSRLNAVIVWDDKELLPLYDALIQELDKPVDLVEIRTAIVDISVDRLHELGVAWSVDAGGIGDGFRAVGGANVAEGTDFADIAGAGLNLTTIYSNGLDMFMARIRALEEDGDAAVLSRPAVLTLDNIEASIEATNTYYIEVAGQEEVDLFDVTYGTILRVIPHVNPDPEGGLTTIRLTVHVEDGGSREAVTGSNVKYPIITKTVVNTQAVVGDGQALIVGGHYYERQSEGESGIPILRSIPALGTLFKTQGGQSQKQERLFILSPRLVTLEDVRRNTGQYAEMFERNLNTPTPLLKRRGGCAGHAPAGPVTSAPSPSVPPSTL
jgi:type III secretion protein C